MKQAQSIIEKDYLIGRTEPRLFGGFIEHLGRGIYSGIYEPGHPCSDEQGFRRDVLELAQELGISMVRYPGGNFVSSYNWTDGIGPRENRPKRWDVAWRAIETNEIGMDEFMDWSRKANLEVMAAVNLGTGNPAEAGALVEYCNFPAGTSWSDMRRKNGHEQAYHIKTWCLGNEQDNPWQIGALTAEEYGRKARETAKIMRRVDPEIELVSVGTSSCWKSTFPEWDRVTLEHLYDQVDYISLHRYYGNEGLAGDYLGSFVHMDHYIRTIIATADYVKARTHNHKILGLAVDEWNVLGFKTWEKAPPGLEQQYNLLDALVFGGLFCTLLQHVDRVKIACLGQLVNVLAPILTAPGGAVIRQTIFYPFQQVSAFGRGEVLRHLVSAPVFESQLHGEVPVLQSAVVFNRETGEISVFALNCDQEESVELSLDFRSFGKVTPLEHQVMDGPDLTAVNSFSEPERVKPRIVAISGPSGNIARVVLPKLSWNMLRFAAKG
jgi:alpha-N-arabinofuranosidase